jgi:hypothetical protein
MEPVSKQQKMNHYKKEGISNFEEGFLFLRTLWRVGGLSKSFKFSEDIYFNSSVKLSIIGNLDLDLPKSLNPDSRNMDSGTVL